MNLFQRLRLLKAALIGQIPQPAHGTARKPAGRSMARLAAATAAYKATRGHAADSFSSPYSGIGVEGRDRAASHQVAAPSTLTRQDCCYLWEGSTLVKRAVSKRAAVALSRGVRLSVGEGNSRFLDQELKRLKALKAALMGRSWGNLFGGALVLVHVDGGSDPATPLDMDALRSVVRLEVVDRWDVSFVRHASRPLGGGASLTSYASAGKPESYRLAPIVGGQTWHHSRVFRFDGHPLTRQRLISNQRWHASVLVAMHAALSRYGIGIQALATQLEDSNVGVWGIKGWNEMVSGDDDAVGEWLDNQILFRSILGDYACDAEMDSFEFKGRPLKDSVEVFSQVKEDLAAAVDMPAVELFGTAPAGLSSDDKGARKKWHTDIDTFERPVFAEFLEWLLPMLQAQSSCPADLKDQPVEISWDSLETLSALEEEGRREKRSQEGERLIKAGVVKPSEARRRLRSDPTWELDDDEEVTASLSPLEQLRQGGLVAAQGLLHREQEEADLFRGILGMNPWSKGARDRLIEAMQVGLGEGSGGTNATDAAEVDAVLGRGLRLLGQVGAACDALIGDGSKVGLFLPLPPELASLRPALSEDTSPAHITLLYVGNIQGREEEFETVVRRCWEDHPGECRAHLRDVSSLISRSGQLVMYQDVTFSVGSSQGWPRPLHAFREHLVMRLRQLAFPVADISPDDWLPHLTLAYLEDAKATWGGVPIHGSWHVSGPEIWGLDEVVRVPGDTS